MARCRINNAAGSTSTSWKPTLLHVKDGLSGGPLFQILVEPSCTVKDLIRSVAATTDTHERRVRLVWAGRPVKTPDDMLEVLMSGTPTVRLVRVQPSWKISLDCLASDTRILDSEECTKYGLETTSVLKQLLEDRGFVLAAVQESGGLLRRACQGLRADREVVLAAVRESGGALAFAAMELQDDHEIVLTAVSQNGDALGFASEDKQNCDEIVHVAVQECGDAFRFASERLRQNEALALLAIQNSGAALKHAAPILKQDLGFLAEAIKVNGEAFEYIPKERRKHKELATVAEDFWARGGGSQQQHLQLLESHAVWNRC